jgi:CubicO group peptidase (beta-lactamase class C family)
MISPTRRAALLAALAAGVLAGQTDKLNGFDELVAAFLKDWQVPGLALAVVDNGKVALARGYGYRDVAGQKPVTPQTLFAIGSITKSFTVTAMNTLADEGKLDWDRPARDYLPWFQMADPVATALITPRDLVTHRSGLPRHDTTWGATRFSRVELIRNVRHLEPSKPFRSTYQYNNLMFLTAGYLAGEVAGSSWEELVQRRIFGPLGMKSSNFSVKDSQRAADFALPYERVKEVVQQVPFRVIDEIGPAGSINSNLEDMLRYLEMHLNQGKPVLQEKSWTAMTTPHMAIQERSPHPELGDQTYGMGLALTTYRGEKVISHGGNIDGFSALISWMPARKSGVVILSNLGGNRMLAPLSYTVYDRLLGLPAVDWSARFKAQPQPERPKVAQIQGTAPSHPLADYAGEYQHPAYGRIVVTANGGALAAAFNGADLTLQHFHYDVFDATLGRRAPTKLQFHSGVDGRIRSLSAGFEPAVKEIVFERVHPPARP